MRFRHVSTVTASLLVGMLCTSAAWATDGQRSRERARESVVIDWNRALLEAIRRSALGPPIVARAIGVVHTCIYDAWAAYDARAIGTELGGTLRQPRRERTQRHKEEAVSFAAYRALVNLFPAQQALFDDLMARLSYDPSNTSVDPDTPPGVGNAACAAVLAFRHRDGANQLGDLSGGTPYSDYTGYLPVNTPTTLVDPNRWQPITFSDGRTPGFVAPHWGLTTPFAFPSGDALRPRPPALYPEHAYFTQARELLQISATLTDRQKAIAEYWADGPASELPPGHWNLFAQVVSRRDHHSLDEDVKLFFLVGNAVMDAGIASWDCKRFYDYVRPITTIRFLFQGQPVLAWGGPFQGTRLIDGGNWLPYQAGTFLTPPFAEYVSGHSTFSTAAAEVLRRFTGSDLFFHGTLIPAGASRFEPGFTPARPVLLFWPTFSAAADEAGLSRRYGGIHFREGDLEGRALGRRVGALVWHKARRLFAGVS